MLGHPKGVLSTATQYFNGGYRTPASDIGNDDDVVVYTTSAPFQNAGEDYSCPERF